MPIKKYCDYKYLIFFNWKINILLRTLYYIYLSIFLPIIYTFFIGIKKMLKNQTFFMLINSSKRVKIC